MGFASRLTGRGRREGFIGKNKAFLRAKSGKNDEFYTQLADIEAELSHYHSFLCGKSIYCPCDNPYQSQFVTYFLEHFNTLHLKQLVATCYDASFSQLSLFEDYDESGELLTKPKTAYQLVVQEVGEATGLQEVLKLEKNSLTVLDGNGDFRSEESVSWMKKLDVIITNPPFSLFRELLRLLWSLEKDFVLLGSSQAITYVEAFGRFQRGELKVGATPFSSSLDFEVPKGNEFDRVREGKLYKKVPIAWYTSFPIPFSPQKLVLTNRFVPQNYEVLDDDPRILNIDHLADIPLHYRGKLAVPVTFLRVWDKNEYQLLGKIEKGMVKGKEKYTRLLIQRCPNKN